MIEDRLHAKANVDAEVSCGGDFQDALHAHGVFVFTCFKPDGQVAWRDVLDNTVAIVGKNLMLDAALSGTNYTVTGPYLGLISSIGFTGISPDDTMAAHAGWKEAGPTNAPDYTGNRKPVLWNPANAGSKSSLTPVVFTISNDGVVVGGFICFGTGALLAKDSTAGVLWAAGTFVSGNKPVGPGYTVNVSYACSI